MTNNIRLYTNVLYFRCHLSDALSRTFDVKTTTFTYGSLLTFKLISFQFYQMTQYEANNHYEIHFRTVIARVPRTKTKSVASDIMIFRPIHML